MNVRDVDITQHLFTLLYFGHEVLLCFVHYELSVAQYCRSKAYYMHFSLL